MKGSYPTKFDRKDLLFKKGKSVDYDFPSFFIFLKNSKRTLESRKQFSRPFFVLKINYVMVR